MGLRLEGRYENGHWMVGAGPKDPVDYDARLPADMGGAPWHPEAWIPATSPPPPATTPWSPGRACLWKVCDYRLVPKAAAEVVSWAGNNLVPALTASAGYLFATNGTLGLPGATMPRPHNVTAAVSPAANPNAALLPLIFLPPLVLAGGYAAYRFRNGFTGQPNAAGQPEVPGVPEALPLREV
jgi:hypothetical protein